MATALALMGLHDAMAPGSVGLLPATSDNLLEAQPSSKDYTKIGDDKALSLMYPKQEAAVEDSIMDALMNFSLILGGIPGAKAVSEDKPKYDLKPVTHKRHRLD
jgi:hypothetical protein